jgi:hypothetical protein
MMGRPSLQMFGHHFGDSKPAMASRQGAAHGLHGNGVKLISTGIGIRVGVGSWN